MIFAVLQIIYCQVWCVGALRFTAPINPMYCRVQLALYSLHANPLSRIPEQVKLDLNKWK